MGMGEKQSAGDGDEDGKNQPATVGSDTPGLHAPFKYCQSDDQHGEKTMEQDFGMGKSRPEANRAERPGFRIAAKKKKCREPEESQRPIARPGDSSCLRDQDRKSTRLKSSHTVISYAVFCLKKTS